MSTNLPSPRKAFATYLVEGDFSKGMISWGEDALRAGVSGSATCLLAGADFEKPSEIYGLFEKAMLEQGLEVPSMESRCEWFETYICDFLVSGEITSNEAIIALYSLWVESEFDKRFGNWLMLSESICLLEDGYGGMEPFEKMTLETIDEFLLREARRVLKSSDVSLFEGGSETN